MKSHDDIISEYEKRVYGEGEMPAHNKAVLRSVLEQGDKENHRDYTPADEGEEMEKSNEY